MKHENVSFAGVFIGEISKHSPAPWFISSHGLTPFIRSEKDFVCDMPSLNLGDNETEEMYLARLHIQRSNAQRIVACVNAMEGIADVNAARALIDDPRTAAATDMVETLRLAEKYCPVDVQDIIRKVLYKAEGIGP